MYVCVFSLFSIFFHETIYRELKYMSLATLETNYNVVSSLRLEEKSGLV